MLDEKHIVDQTFQWINSFIIQLNLCPFAKSDIENNKSRLTVCQTQDVDTALTSLNEEFKLLDSQTNYNSSLLIFSDLLKDFFAYLDFVDLAEAHLADAGYQGIYQLATFHPDYCFAEVNFTDVSNYTNRSPYPMLHILREKSVTEAIAWYGDTTKIPENNIKCLRNLGLEKVKKILETGI